VKLPRHIALSLSHNEHAGNYQTVEEYVDAPGALDDPDDWVSPEERAKAIATGELWECRWNPDTPVGSCLLRASNLDALLAALAKIADEEGAEQAESDSARLRERVAALEAGLREAAGLLDNLRDEDDRLGAIKVHRDDAPSLDYGGPEWSALYMPEAAAQMAARLRALADAQPDGRAVENPSDATDPR
jgi:hypothetical protein